MLPKFWYRSLWNNEKLYEICWYIQTMRLDSAQSVKQIFYYGVIVSLNLERENPSIQIQFYKLTMSGRAATIQLLRRVNL